MVAAIEPSSPAHKGGLEVGDVILKVGERPVSGPEALEQALAAQVADAALLLVRRDGTEIYIGVTLAGA